MRVLHVRGCCGAGGDECHLGQHMVVPALHHVQLRGVGGRAPLPALHQHQGLGTCAWKRKEGQGEWIVVGGGGGCD